MQNKKEKPNYTRENYKGIKIHTVAVAGTIACIVVLCIIMSSLHGIIGEYKTLVNDVNLYVSSQECMQKLQDASDRMTNESRLYASTREKKHMDRYFEIVNNREREKALEELRRVLPDPRYDESISRIENALRESNNLMNYEIHSMKLIADITDLPAGDIPKQVVQYQMPDRDLKLSVRQKSDRAYDLVYGKEYCRDKELIVDDVSTATDQLMHRLKKGAVVSMEDIGPMMQHLLIEIIVLIALLAAVFVFISLLIVKPLKVFSKCVRENRTLDLMGAYEFKYLASTYNEIFELNRQNKQNMKFKIDHDALTNVCSRNAFEEHKAALAGLDIPIIILMVDIDNFKSINDNYGHEAGDEILIRVADMLCRYFRKDDIVARVGGDEFAVILRDVHPHNIESICQKLDMLNGELKNPDGDILRTSVSVGVAVSGSKDVEEAYRHADVAMYKAKENGKGHYCIYRQNTGDADEI